MDLSMFKKGEGSEGLNLGLPKPKEIPNKIKRKIKEYARVLRITKKPSREEYKSIVKASALGMVVIGLIGFAIHMVAQLLTMYS